MRRHTSQAGDGRIVPPSVPAAPVSAEPRSTLGLVAAGLAAVAVTALLAVRTAALVIPFPDVGALGVDRTVELVVVPVGLLVAAWLAGWLVLALLCVAAVAVGARRRALERVVARYAPALVRRLLVSAVGVGLGLGTSAATAVTSPGADDLGWTVTGTAEAGESRTAPTAVSPEVPVPTAASVATASPPTPMVVVTPGDSLWRIAARHLPDGATDAQVTAAWPRWYAANAHVVGADPDLVRPGQVLVVPGLAPGSAASPGSAAVAEVAP